MTFDEWYNKTYPDTVEKHDVINIACRSSAFFGWESAEKQTAKEIIEILEENLDHDYEKDKLDYIESIIKEKYGLDY